jgi:LmbE family N-acetylglucosaminyl deacetylase
MAVARADVSRVLVVTAHPDDVDFGAAGTVAAWTAAGISVSYCVCTSGEASDLGAASRATEDLLAGSSIDEDLLAGSSIDEDLLTGSSRAEVASIRRAEQRAAAGQVGVREVTFLDYPDGEVVASIELRRDVARVIRRVRPDRVLTWSPEINWEFVPTTHPDHRAVGEATFAAVYPDARNRHAHPSLLADEGLEPWTVRELWLADAPVALRNHAVDVTDVFEARMAALHAHVSQVGGLPELAERMRLRLADIARRHGLPAGRLAEEFQVVGTG